MRDRTGPLTLQTRTRGVADVVSRAHPFGTFRDDIGIKLESIPLSDLGRAKRSTVDKDNTIIVEGAGKSVYDDNVATGQ